MIVVDASVWVSHLIAPDVYHTISRSWLTNRVNEGTSILAPSLLLAEVAGAIARRTGEPTLGHQAFIHILSTPGLRLVHANSELGLLAAQLAADYRLRGADAMYAAVAHHLSVPLVSWDKEQIDRVANVITAYSPTEET